MFITTIDYQEIENIHLKKQEEESCIHNEDMSMNHLLTI